MEYEMAMDILGDAARAERNAWLVRLDAATSVAEVVVLAKEFLATWNAAELAKLPEECAQDELNSSDDIAYYAYRLVREQCSGDTQCIELHRMATFFASASQRVSQILAIAKYQKLIRAVDIAEWMEPAGSLGFHPRHGPEPLDVEAKQRGEAEERVDQLPIRHRQE
jgi:hypothetical protein